MNSYPMDIVYNTSVPYEYSLTFPFEPETMSAPSYQFPTTSSEIDYSNVLENGGTVDPLIPTYNKNENENEIENIEENEKMLRALRLFSIEYTEKQLKNAREMKERLSHNNTTISDDVRLKRLDIANKKIKQFKEKLEYLKSNKIYDSSLIDSSSCSVS